MRRTRAPRNGGWLWGRLLYPPSVRRWRPHPVLAEWRRLEAEQWLPPDEASARHRSRLVQAVCHAVSRVPLYRQRLQRLGLDVDALQLPEDLVRLPILDRDTLAAASGSLMATGGLPAGCVWNHTGGSTGQPVSFLQEDDYRIANLAAVARHDRWAGWEFGARTALLWGADRDRAVALPWRERLAVRWLRRQVELDAFDLGPKAFAAFTDTLARFRPQVLRGYASVLERYAAYLEETGGRRFPAPAGIISCAETLSDPARERIERAFGAVVRDRYGSREFGLIASQCESGRYHVNTRGVWVEILDGERPAPPGGVGRVVITGLASRAMPLLRYETGDVAEVAATAETCPCGRGLPVMGRVFGRVSDFIAAPDGRLVHGEFFTHLFYARAAVRAFAVDQQADGTVVLSVVGDGPRLRSDVDHVLARIRQRLGPDVPVAVRRLECLERPASGKRCFVRSQAAAARWAAGGVQASTGEHP